MKQPFTPRPCAPYSSAFLNTEHINPGAFLMTTSQPQLHRTFQVYFEGAHGERTAPVEGRIHVSRTCTSCAHDGLKNAEWRADGGIYLYGRCMNGCGAIDAPDPGDRWCDSHATPREWAAGVSRIARPVLILVKNGGAV